MSPHSQGLNGEKYAVIIGDRYSKWILRYPVGSKSADETYACFTYFFGPCLKIKYLRMDSSEDLRAAAKSLGVPNGFSTPGILSTNRYGESYVKVVARGIKVMLASAG